MIYPQAVSHGNVLSFTPPGFKQMLNVKFPDCRLAVCERCKKNYKTRDMCRVRNAHTAEPWTTAYICITLDASCTDQEGKFIDTPLTVRMVQWQPFCVKTPFDSKTPVCASCKKTNRTRTFCRDRHQHRQLPWCTVYVMLSALEKTDPNTVVAAPSTLVTSSSESNGKEEKKTDENRDDSDAKEIVDQKSNGNELKVSVKNEDENESNDIAEGQTVTAVVRSEQHDDAAKASDDEKNEKVPTSEILETNTLVSVNKEAVKISGDEEGDNINTIDDSRTFLAKVSCRSTTIHWLELTDYDPGSTVAVLLPTLPGIQSQNVGTTSLTSTTAKPVGMDPSQYYVQMGVMGYPSMQHQQALQMQQQHFMQMQHQHFAAQQAAWQAQYNQQIQMQMGVNGVMPVAPSVAGVPVAAASTATSAATPTVVEATAVKQKENEGVTTTPQIVQPSAGAAAVAAAQAQAQAQWQAQMMYQQQLYQQQLHMQHMASQQAQAMPQPAPAAAMAPTPASPITPTPAPATTNDTAAIDLKKKSESNAKRQRVE